MLSLPDLHFSHLLSEHDSITVCSANKVKCSAHEKSPRTEPGLSANSKVPWEIIKHGSSSFTTEKEEKVLHLRLQYNWLSFTKYIQIRRVSSLFHPFIYFFACLSIYLFLVLEMDSSLALLLIYNPSTMCLKRDLSEILAPYYLWTFSVTHHCKMNRFKT